MPTPLKSTVYEGSIAHTRGGALRECRYNITCSNSCKTCCDLHVHVVDMLLTHLEAGALVASGEGGGGGAEHHPDLL
eukprot:1194169-Prorocentrum_minimum.AAC.2